MAFQVSPGVQVKELDLTTIIPTIATTPAGFVGLFEWGPANEVVSISSENELRSVFGLPNDVNAKWWFTASSFLRYGSNLQTVRAESADARLAGVAGGQEDGFPIPFDITSQTTGGPWANSDFASSGSFMARYPGSIGNSIGVAVWDAAAVLTDAVDGGNFSDWGPTEAKKGLWASYIAGGTPDTSQDAQNRVGEGHTFNDELHIIVYDADGNLTGTQYTPLEIYEGVSKAVDAKLSDGSTNYYRARINNQSNWILAARSIPSGTSVNGFEKTINQVWASGEGGVEGAFDAFFEVDSTTTRIAMGITLSTPEGFTASAVGKSIYAWEGGTLSEAIIYEITTAATGNTYQEIVVSLANDGTEGYGFTLGATFAAFTPSASAGFTGEIGGPEEKFTLSTVALGSGLRNGKMFTGGVSEGDVGGNGSETAIQQQYVDQFETASTDVSVLIAGPADTTLASRLVDIAETRKDCVVAISPELDDVNQTSGQADAVLAYRDAINPKSSYAIMDTGWKVVYDQYRDTYRSVPLNGDIAGLIVRTDEDSEPWFSPAGFNRGRLRNVVKLYYSPGKTDRDRLYVKGVNPVVNFENEGIVLYGDKTMQAKPSALDRINIRRLFNILEKSIATAANFSLFEFNDEFTRASFRNLVEPFLRDVQSRRGITDFKVVCDETNNTPSVIDRNEFVADIYVKPARSINFITLNFVLTPTGVDFTEIGA